PRCLGATDPAHADRHTRPEPDRGDARQRRPGPADRSGMVIHGRRWGTGRRRRTGTAAPGPRRNESTLGRRPVTARRAGPWPNLRRRVKLRVVHETLSRTVVAGYCDVGPCATRGMCEHGSGVVGGGSGFDGMSREPSTEWTKVHMWSPPS